MLGQMTTIFGWCLNSPIMKESSSCAFKFNFREIVIFKTVKRWFFKRTKQPKLGIIQTQHKLMPPH